MALTGTTNYILQIGKQMKHIFYFIVVVLFSCSKKGDNSFVATPKNIYEYTSQVKKNTDMKTTIVKDTVKAKYYQTFDEYTMSGKGLAKLSPFVYVRKWDDSIFVVSSDKNDSVRLYTKLNSNIWYSHMEYDMWKKQDYALPKDGLSRPARTYDRFFYNDTILELETMYIGKQQHQRIYIKSNKDLYIINNIQNVNNSNYSELRRIVNRYLLSKNVKVHKYSLKEYSHKYIYEGKMDENNYSYDKKAYGFWGIQPGIEETFLYEGINVREYSDNLDSFQRDHSNYVYSLVDEMPAFPTGFDGLQDFVRKNRVTSLLVHNTKPYRVVIEVIIEKDGSITNARIAKSIDPLHDEDALRIVGIMPKWIPAKQNGKTVRCKVYIPVSYTDQRE
jgi:TonB family protein